MKCSQEKLESCKRYREAHKEERAERERRRWREGGKEKYQAWYRKNWLRIRTREKASRKKNDAEIKRRYKERYSLNPRPFLDKNKRWRDKNKEAVRILGKKWRTKNWEAIKEKQRQWKARTGYYKKLYIRNKADPYKRIRHALQCRTRHVLLYFGLKKNSKTEALLGADYKTVRDHLAARFKPGMTWNNWGRYGWHIDHIRPCASFDLSDPIQQATCFHYTNLQPLWWRENIVKGGGQGRR